jgi:protein-disulfide isomerase
MPRLLMATPRAAVRRSEALARQFGVGGTPAWLMYGRLAGGAAQES